MLIGAPDKRLLLIEDDDLVRRSISRTLVQAGFDVLEVASSEEALRQVERWRFDLCLVDIKLPHMDGLQFLERTQHLLRGTGKVVLTGYGSLDEAIRSMEVGAHGFVIKPISPEALLTAVRSVLTQQKLCNESHRRGAYEPLLKMLTNMVSPQPDLFRALDRFLYEVMTLTHAVRGALFLVRQKQLKLHRSDGFLLPPEPPPPRLVQKVLDKGEVLLANGEGVLSWPTLESLGTGDTGSICIPLISCGKVHGLTLLERFKSSDVFSQSEIEFIRIASALVAPTLEGLSSGVPDLVNQGV